MKLYGPVKASAFSTKLLKHDVTIILILLALSTVVWLPRLSGPLDLRWDAAVYYTLGTSLAQGHGYRLLNEPGIIEAIQYPPFLPLIVAAYQSILRTDDPDVVGHWLRLTFAVMFIAYIVSTYLVLKGYLPIIYAFIATLICLVNPTLIVISNFCLADVPFALIVSLFFLCSQIRGRPLSTILSALFAVAAYTMRTAGLALLAAWVAESLFNRKLKQALARFVLALLPVLCWQLYVHRVEAGSDYAKPAYEYQRDDYMYYNVSYARNISLVDPFVPGKGHIKPSSFTRRYVHNLIRMPKTLGETVSARLDFWRLPFTLFNPQGLPSWALSWFVLFVPICLGGLILGGICLQLIERQWLIPLYTLFSLAMICSTPFTDMFTRYMIPVIPYVALALFVMLIKIRDQAGKKWRGKGLILSSTLNVLVVCLCLLQSPVSLGELYIKYHQQVSYHDRRGAMAEYRLFYYDEACRALDAGIYWLKSSARPGGVVAASMPHWVYLRTGLKTVMPPFEPDLNKMQNLLDSIPATYVVLDQTLHGKPADTTQYVSPAVRQAPDRWRPIYSDREGGCEIYQRVSEEPAAIR
jgi:hypothetical protein